MKNKFKNNIICRINIMYYALRELCEKNIAWTESFITKLLYTRLGKCILHEGNCAK